MHRTMEELKAGLEEILQSPRNFGALELIVRRPRIDARELLDAAELDVSAGLVGDNWRTRGSRHTADGSAHPDTQVTIMNSRAIALLAGDRSRWQLAGDQLFVDLDLSVNNLPAGTRLSIGSAVVEISARPHTGCKKFANRYGVEAIKFVNSTEGCQLRLRGANAKVVQPGQIKVGDVAFLSNDIATDF